MKKILNIFASVSLITAGASSVVACGSHQNPKPPKSEIQKLYDQLDGQTFTIQDNNFWGNEANYKQDLLTDLEKKANITTQQDKDLLSLNSDLKTLDQPGNYSFAVNIGTGKAEQTAFVTIDWKLTDAQIIPGLFNFYTKIWPQDFQTYQQYEGTEVTKLFLTIWDKTTKNWPQDLKNSLTWSAFAKDLLNVFFGKSSFFLIPPELQPYFHIQTNMGIDSLNVNEYKQVKNPFYFQKTKNDPKIFLPYYNYSQYTPFSPHKGLPKANQSWTVGYNTDYNLIQNKLKKDKTIYKLLKSGLYPPYTASNNSGYIEDKLSDAGYSSIVADMSFTGNIKIDGTQSPIEIYYNNVDQGFTIKIEVVNDKPILKH